jgi:hypothetical protein
MLELLRGDIGGDDLLKVLRDLQLECVLFAVYDEEHHACSNLGSSNEAFHGRGLLP